MTDAPKPSNRRRRRIVVTTIAVLLLGLGWIWLSADRGRISSADFWAFLARHPSVASCVKPLYALVGRQQEFMQALAFADLMRISHEKRLERGKRFREILERVEGGSRWPPAKPK